jgi:hypothetical protein
MARLDDRQPGTANRRSENVRTGTPSRAIAQALLDNLRYLQAKLAQHATRNDWYMALAYTVRDRLIERHLSTVGSSDIWQIDPVAAGSGYAEV